MKNTDEELLKLMQQLVDSQYGKFYDSEDLEAKEKEIAELELAEELKRKFPQGMRTVNIDNMSSKEIKEIIPQSLFILIGKFKIKLARKSQDIYGINIWEENNTTALGRPCKIDSAINYYKDPRFKDKDVFGKNMGKLTFDELFEIIRWIQAVSKLSAFL